MRALLCIVIVAAVAAVALLWSQNRQLQVAHSRVARALEQNSAALLSLREEQDRAATEHRATVRRLEGEAQRALATRDKIVSTLDARRDELVGLAAAQRERVAESTKAPPEAVRIALAQLNLRLREDGHGGVRFLHATAIEEKALRNVEFLESRAAAFSTAVWTAGEIRFELDREHGSLTLLCFDGHVVGGGDVAALPEEGRPLTLQQVDGPAWEAVLPYLVAAKGSYPVDEAERIEQAPPKIDRGSAVIWAERIDAVLDLATTDIRYRVDRLRDLRDGVFHDVLINGYGGGKRLEVSLRVQKLTVEVDGSSVALFARDGVLLRRDGKVEIGEEGYRILLPGIDPTAARSTMLGMVSAAR